MNKRDKTAFELIMTHWIANKDSGEVIFSPQELCRKAAISFHVFGGALEKAALQFDLERVEFRVFVDCDSCHKTIACPESAVETQTGSFREFICPKCNSEITASPSTCWVEASFFPSNSVLQRTTIGDRHHALAYH